MNRITRAAVKEKRISSGACTSLKAPPRHVAAGAHRPMKIAVTLSSPARTAALAGTSTCREGGEERPRVRLRPGRHARFRTVGGHREQGMVG
jgi:hypothetical protein